MTQARFKIKTGDYVQVMAWSEKGRFGLVVKVFLDKGTVIVNTVRHVVRFTRPSHATTEGKISKNLPISISNVAVVDPSTGKPSRLGVRFNADGKKERFFKKSLNSVVDNTKRKERD